MPLPSTLTLKVSTPWPYLVWHASVSIASHHPRNLNEALTHTACCGVGCTEGPEGAEDDTVVEVDVFPIPDAYIAEVYERFNDGSAASGTKLTDMLEDTGILMDSTVEAAVLAFYELHGCVNNCWCRWILF